MPRRSASVMIGFGQSWCMVTTSMPWSARLSVVEVILAGSHQLPVNTTVVVAAWFTDMAPRSKAVTFSSVWGIGNAQPTLIRCIVIAKIFDSSNEQKADTLGLGRFFGRVRNDLGDNIGNGAGCRAACSRECLSRSGASHRRRSLGVECQWCGHRQHYADGDKRTGEWDETFT